MDKHRRSLATAHATLMFLALLALASLAYSWPQRAMPATVALLATPALCLQTGVLLYLASTATLELNIAQALRTGKGVQAAFGLPTLLGHLWIFLVAGGHRLARRGVTHLPGRPRLATGHAARRHPVGLAADVRHAPPGRSPGPRQRSAASRTLLAARRHQPGGHLCALVHGNTASSIAHHETRHGNLHPPDDLAIDASPRSGGADRSPHR